MSKKTKRKGNLKYSLLLLLLLAVLLVSSTYAWFTSNQVVEVSTLDVRVEAKNGLQISTDASDWKTVLSLEDLENANTTYAANTNQIPEIIEPVSTAGTVTSGYLDMYYGQVTAPDGEYILTATKEEAEVQGTDGRYIAFDIFLRVDQDTDIVLTTDSNVVFKADTTDRALQNAARVAFLDKGTSGVDEAPSVAQALNEGDASSLIIWEPNNDVHSAAAVQHAKSTYDIDTTETGADPIPYDGIKAEITEENNVLVGDANVTDNSEYFATVTTQISTPEVMPGNQTFMTLTAGITKIRVYMWVEGQDVDCENQASGSDISFNLQFAVDGEEP